MNISTRSEMNVIACNSANAFKKFLSRITMMLSLFVLVNETVVGQNSFNSGDGWGSGWGTGAAFSTSAGSSLIYTTTNSSGSGNRFFRFFGTGTPCGEYGPSGASDVLLSPATKYTSSTITCGSSKAFYLSVSNTTDNWVFKSASSTGQSIIIFRVQGSIQSVSSVSQSPTVANGVAPGQAVTVTATLSGSLSTGQNVYLRYTTNNFTSSTIATFTGSGTSYTATIPAATNTAGANVKFYVFTSGAAPSAADADFYTINLNNNGGSNYEYTVASNFYSKSAGSANLQTTSNWGTATDGSGTAPVDFAQNGVTYNIRNSATTTIGANWTVSGTGSKIVVGNGADSCYFDLPDALSISASVDISDKGVFKRSTTASPTFGTINVANGGTYWHAVNGFTIPTATWGATSVCKVTGSTSSGPAGTAQSFGVVIWDCPGQNTILSISSNFFFTSPTVNIISTGSSFLQTVSDLSATGSWNLQGGRIVANVSTFARTLTIQGSLNITGGLFEISNTSGSAVHQLVVNQSVTINGGSLEINKSALTAGRLYVKGNLTLSSGSIVYTQGGTTGSSGIYFDGSGAQTFTHSGGTLSTATGGIGRRFYYKTTSGPTGLNETYSSSSAQTTISGSEGTAAAGYAAWPTGSLISGFTVSNSAGVTLSTNKLITGTVTLSSGSLNLGGNTLTLNSGASAQSVTGGGSNAFNITNGTISLTGSGAHTITLSSFGTTSSGGLTLGTDVTLQMNSNAALNCGGNGTTTSMLTVLGTLQLNSGTNSNIAGTRPPFYGSASTLEYKVSYNVFDEWASGTAITTPGVPQNVTINGSGITVTTPASERNVKGNLLVSVGNFTLNAALGGDLKVAGNITNNATFTHSNRAVYLNGSSGSAQTLNGTLNGTTTTNCFPYLFLDNTSGGVTLNTAVNVTNTLTLTSGVITTNGNVFHITNGAANAISGGSSSSYINGSLRRSITAGTGTWAFPVGKGGSYLPYGITNPAGSSLVVTAEAFATSVSGSPSVTAPLLSISSGEYWTVTNTGTFTSGTISLARGTIGSVNVVGSSTSAGGSYSSLGGGAVNSTLIASNTITAASASTGNFGSPTYFVLGSASLPPTVSAVSASPNDGTNTNAYNGSTITVTGTNFTSGMTVTLSSGADVSADYTLSSATQITFALPTAASGTVTVQNAAGSATSSSSLVNVGYRTTTTGNYNNAATWLGGVAPSASSDLTIAHNVTLNQNLTQTGLVKINTGATLTVPLSTTLQIEDGIEGDGALAVNGTLQINTGGYTVISPTYGNASTLIYNALEPYGRFNEWNATSGAGYPNNVVISGSGTILNLGNGGTSTARQLAGNLTVNAGSTLTLNGAGAQMTAALTVKGNYTNSGTTILSGLSGGDLKLEGNLADNGTFTANGRAIFFEGSGNQTISSTTSPLDFDVMRIAKSGGELILGTDLLADETGDPIQFTTAASILNLNGRTATFGKAGTASTITMTSGSAIKGSSTSSIIILGTGVAGTIRFDQTTPGTTNVLNNFTLSRTSSGAATLGNALIIAGTIDVEGGATLTTGGNLTLRSNATSTARVADLSDNAGGTISGNVTVERYVQARRKWRALTAPLTGGSDNSIHFNWQNNGVSAGSTGAIMWRPGGSNGLYSAGVGSSILSYNSSANSWTQLTSTQSANSLFSSTANNPYMVFVTGPFNTTGTYITSGSAPTTLSAKGALRTGDVSYTGSSLGAYVMIGNPYASPINLKTTLTGYGTRSGSGLGTTFVYVWNPGTASVGAYETINTSSASSIIIESGQAFFMATTGASATLPFKESDKVSTTSNLTYFRTSDVAANPQISIDLNKYVNDVASKYDNATCDFVSGANAGIDGNDADKPTQFNENMSIFRDGKDLSWETRPSISVNDELPLRMWAMKQSGYQLKISTSNFTLPAGSTALLIDKFLNRETPITLNGTTLVDFNVTSEAASSGDRFKVVFRSSAVTPVTNLNGEKGFAIYPNPVVKGTDMQLEFRNKAAGKYTLTVYSITGIQVQQNVVRHNGGTAVQVVGLDQRLSAGNYLVEVMNEKGDREQVRLTIQ